MDLRSGLSLSAQESDQGRDEEVQEGSSFQVDVAGDRADHGSIWNCPFTWAFLMATLGVLTGCIELQLGLPVRVGKTERI